MTVTVETKRGIEEHLQALFSPEKVANARLREAALYALFPGGKRLRPNMLLSITGNAGLDAAAAIELVHTYSLIHDDLPAMDNDDFRRGRPSLHKAFDEATAILTGDFLLTYAFEILASSPLPSPTLIKMLQIFGESLGTSGIVGGQMLDLTCIPPDWETYQTIAHLKTARLFALPLHLGALIQNLTIETTQNYIAFGNTFGLLYQLKDDLLDEDPCLSLLKGHIDLKGVESLLQTAALALAKTLNNSFLIHLMENLV